MIKNITGIFKGFAGKAAVAAVLAAVLGLQPCMSVSAGQFVTDPGTMLTRYKEDDGSYGEFKWVQIPYGYTNAGRWVYIGPQGYIIAKDYALPGSVFQSGESTYGVDERIRSAAIGVSGQQPVFSVASAKKDIMYAGTRQMVDAIPLYPDMSTGFPVFDDMLNQVFAQTMTPDMDTHDKLKACYDYLIATFTDPRYEGGELDYSKALTYDMSNINFDATALFFSGSGVCDNFASAFAVMSWKIGVPIYLASGETSKAGGGFTTHTWCQLDGADGKVYVFDPHIDYLQALRSGKPFSYARFGVPLEKVAGNYKNVTRIFDVVR